MEVPLQITTRDFDHSEALDARIRDNVARLERFHPRITSARVTVEQVDRHRQQGRHFSVHVDVAVPGRDPIVATRKHHEDVYVAVRDAFDAVGRRLEEVAREMRGEVKSHEATKQGRVARVFADQGYGFIRASDGTELYFSADNVAHPSFSQLAPGTAVDYIEELAGEGPQAKRVSARKPKGLGD